MPISSELFFPLVSGYLLTLSLFTTGHNSTPYVNSKTVSIMTEFGLSVKWEAPKNKISA